MGKSFEGRSGRGGGHDRGGGEQFGGGGGRFQDRPPRAPLDWQPAGNMIHGGLEVRFSKATNDRGETMFSFTVGRAPQGDRPGNKNIQVRDLPDLMTIGSAVEEWIENARGSSAA